MCPTLQLIHDFQRLAAAGPTSMTETNVHEKAMEMKELSNSLLIVKNILSLMGTANNTMVQPWITDLQNQIGGIETATDNFLLVLSDHLPVEESDSDTLRHRPDRRLSGQPVDFEVPMGAPGFQASTGDKNSGYPYGYHDVPGSFDWKKETSVGGATQGFKSKRAYRNWKNQNIQAHPHMKSFFDTLDDLESENYDGVHKRVLQQNKKLHSDLRGRHLSGNSRSRRLNVELIGNQVSSFFA